MTGRDLADSSVGGNAINDNVYILHLECNGECTDISLRQSCNVIENQLGLITQVELIGVSCVHSIPSSSGNQFVDCDDGGGTIGDNECRAFNLNTVVDIPCVDGGGTDVIVTCLATNLPR